MKKRAFNKGVFAFPYVILSGIFIVFPLILMLVYAFIGEDGGISLENFISVFTNSSHYMLILKTVGTALLTTGICLVIAYPIALVLSSSRFNKMAILALLFIIPMWMNFVLRMFALKSLLDMIGIENSYLAAIIGLVYDFLPFMLLPIYTVLVNMDKSYLEASQDLGAGGAKTFLKVTFPLSIPGIVSGVLMVFMPVFSAYAVTDILGGAGSNLIGGKIAMLFGQGQWGVGSALSFVLLLLVFLTMFLGNLLSSKAKKVTAKSIGKGGKLA